ncbi:hypothetical protein MMC29_005821, partial [Sticta canariensis]|nr:hypothetical protein [Sticta canariensis]
THLPCYTLRFSRVAMIGSSNGNVTLPVGVSNHGDPNLLCSPAKWTDIVIFFLGNYFAHAATIRSSPGDSIYVSTINAVSALFFPASGIRRGLAGVFSLAKFGRTDLQIAARAGALCSVVRLDEEKGTPDSFQVTLSKSAELMKPCWSTYNPLDSWTSKKIHGRVCLPKGYALAIVHKTAEFMQDDDPSSPLLLSSNFNAVSVLIALGQLAFAITTLYRSRGDQIARYGYAAFGLTVTPYAFMSLINLLGNLICPQYSALYLVESKEMTEARALPDASFEGCVGKLMDEPRNDQGARRTHGYFSRLLFSWALLLIPIGLSIAVIAGLSHFKKGSSTFAQRAWTMSWLAVGGWVVISPNNTIIERRASMTGTKDGMGIYLYSWLLALIYPVPAIGGFVVVGQMLREYGSCTRID